MSFSVKDLPESERPRERLLKFGADKLSIIELLAVILSSGSANASVFDISQRIVEKFKTLQGIEEASINELLSIKGLSKSKVCQIKAAIELGKRHDEDIILKGSKTIKNADSVAKLISSKIQNKSKECLYIICLNSRKNVVSLISVGAMDYTIAHPREVFSEALKNRAHSIILAHNHPSGSSEPSEEDVKMTKRISEAGKIIGISLVDHIIVGGKDFFSFKRRGIL